MRASVPVIALFALLASTTPPAAAQGSAFDPAPAATEPAAPYAFVVRDAAGLEELLRRRAELLAAAPGPPRAAPEGSVTEGFLLPHFVVDTNNAGGRTTLIAVRNPSDDFVSIGIDYFAINGFLLNSESFNLGPRATVTRNLRDLAGLAVDSDGFARGYAVVEGLDPGQLTGDVFYVNPAEDFADGTRLVPTLVDFPCGLAEVRWGDGGAFGGGTDLVLWIDTPLGADPMSDDPSVTLAFYDEMGMPLGGVDYYSTLNSHSLSISQLLDLIPGDEPPFGAVEILFETGTNGGVAYAVLSAENRYSIGIDSACLAGLLTP